MWDFRNAIGFWAATGLAVLSALLVIVQGWLVTSNVSIRTEVNNRQQYINQSVQLSRLNQELVNALGGLALKNNQAIRQLLAENGITVVGQAAGGPSGTAPAPTGQAPVPLKKP
jgi:hypothetical protein